MTACLEQNNVVFRIAISEETAVDEKEKECSSRDLLLLLRKHSFICFLRFFHSFWGLVRQSTSSMQTTATEAETRDWSKSGKGNNYWCFIQIKRGTTKESCSWEDKYLSGSMSYSSRTYRWAEWYQNDTDDYGNAYHQSNQHHAVFNLLLEQTFVMSLIPVMVCITILVFLRLLVKLPFSPGTVSRVASINPCWQSYALQTCSLYFILSDSQLTSNSSFSLITRINPRSPCVTWVTEKLMEFSLSLKERKEKK